MDADVTLQFIFAKCEKLQAENVSLKKRIEELELLIANNIHGTQPDGSSFRQIEKGSDEDTERKS